LYAIVAAVAFVGCSEFNKALKATGPDSLNLKLQTAEKYYFKQEYERALPLLEELQILTRGTSVSERVGYMYAKSYYGYNDYIRAAYLLSFFVKTFPSSEYAEECAFLAAYCYYRSSPEHSLDQGDTEIAMEQIQLFLVRFPQTELRDSCNTLMDALRWKLEEKDWAGAKQYLHLRRFSSASESLRNFLSTWPSSDHREEAMFLRFKADHRLAMNSIDKKKKERLEAALRLYRNFADAYAESQYSREAKLMLTDIERVSQEQSN